MAAPRRRSPSRSAYRRHPISLATYATRVERELVSRPLASVRFCVDGGSRSPGAVALPLEDVISPCASLDNQQAGQQPAVWQFSLIRASQVVPMPPSNGLKTLPL